MRLWKDSASPSAPRSTVSILVAALAVLVVALSTSPATAAPSGSARAEVQHTQVLVILLGPHAAMSAPDEGSTSLELVPALG